MRRTAHRGPLALCSTVQLRGAPMDARITARSDAASWWLGDWLLFGEWRYVRRYRQAIEVTGLNCQTAALLAELVQLRRLHDHTQHHARGMPLPSSCADDGGAWIDPAITSLTSAEAHNPEVVGSKHRSPVLWGYGVFCFPRDWVCAIRKCAMWTKHGLGLSWQTRPPPACCAARETTTAHQPETTATVR